MTKITLHHLKMSRSHRLIWLLEELEATYDIVTYERTKHGRAPKSLREIHPRGRVPIVVLDDEIVLVESGAIVEELLERLPSDLLPEPGGDEQRRYRVAMHYAEGSLAPQLLVKIIMLQLREAPGIPRLFKGIPRRIAEMIDGKFTDPEIALHLGHLERGFAERQHIAGDRFTAADIMLAYPLVAILQRARDPESYPHVKAYLERVTSRPAYLRATDKGGAPS